MSKSETDNRLRYGQGILLQGYKPHNDPLQGCLTVKGFADTKGYYQTVDDILFFKNYRNAIFQFLPAGNFQINDELTKLIQKVVDTQKEDEQRNAIVQTLKPRAQSQKNQFELTIKTKKKNTIKFGDYVIFRHVDSDNYLSGTIRPSDGSNGAFSVEVSNKLSHFLIFQILPYRSFETESMEIPFSSPVLIKNIANNGYLTFQKIGMNLGDDDMNKYIVHKPTQSDQSYRIPVKTNSHTSKRYQLVTHFVDLSMDDQITPMPWIYQLHFKDVDNDSLIQHDVVYLQHTQNNGILSAVGQDIVLKQSKVDNGEQISFYESFWEIQQHNETSNSYILRHLMSGMTLGIIKDQNNDPSLPKLFDISAGKGFAELGIIQLVLAKKQGGIINSDSFVNIAWGQYTLDITQQQQQQQQNTFGKSSVGFDDIIPLKKMKKAAIQEVQYQIRRLKFTGDISKHCFVIHEIPDDLKKQLLFALSFHSTIINLRQDLKLGAVQATKRISYIRMMKVTQKISEIIDFLKDCPADHPDKQFIPSSTKRQLICKDLGLSQLLFELLFFMNENMNEDIFKDKANENQKFMQMYKTIYQVIINLIANNKIFKIHVSKWILFILNDVIVKNSEIYFRTLMQLLHHNNFFTQNFVTQQLIDYLFQKMIKQRDNKEFSEKRYLQILRKFCICGQTILSANQIIILNNFIGRLKTDPQASVYHFQLILKDGQIYCKAALDKKKLRQYKFEEFQTIVKSKDQQTDKPLYPEAWQYYMTLLNLLADLTQGRSKKIERFMSQLLPLNMLTELFEKYQLNEFQVPIIKVFHYLYFQNENYYPIEQQKKITAFPSIKQDQQLKVNQFTTQYSPWDTLQRILLKILAKLQASGPILAKQVKKNEALYSLLCVTRETLNLGFWNKKQDLEKIYSYILNILQPHAQTKYQEVIKIKYENNLLIDCKIQCINIIDLIIYQDSFMTTQIISQVFKHFQFPNSAQKFSIEVSKLLQVPQDIQFADKFLSNFRQKVSNYQNIVKQDIFDIVLELAKYNSADLTKKSLNVLERVFENEKKRLQLFYEQFYICEKNSVQFSEYLIRLRNKFFTLEDFNTPCVTYDNQSQNYFPIYKESEGVMQNLYLINELMKNQASLENIDSIQTLDTSDTFKNLSTDRLINFTNQRKSSNLSKQKLVAATNIHLKILNYIINCSEFPESQLAMKLLHLCYKFLVGLIQNHQQIKMKLLPYLPHIMKHIDANIGCLDFLKQMYDNNKNMLFNEGQIISLIRKVCDIVENQGDTFYKSKVLDFLRYLIYLNNKPLKNNQILILKILQDDDYKKIMLRPDQNMIADMVVEYEKKNGSDFEFPSNQVIVSNKLAYMISYFQILTSLVDENNNVNSGKLQKRLPFDKVLDMIKVCNKCYMLKRNIRAFLNRMYYYTPGTDAYLSQIVSEETKYIIQDLNQLIKLKNRTDVDRLEELKFQNPIRFSYFQSYVYLNFEQILFSLYSILNTGELYNQIESYLKNCTQNSLETSYSFIKLAERLGWLRNYFTQKNNVPTTSIIKFLQKRLRLLFQSLPFEVYKPAFKNSMEQQTQTNKRSYIIEKILHGDIGQFYTQPQNCSQTDLPLSFISKNKPFEPKQKKQPNWEVLSNQLRKIFTRKKRQFESEEDEIKYKMQKVVSGLKMSPSIKVKLSEEFKQKLFKKVTDEDSLFQYIQTLIGCNNQNPQLFSDDLKIFILQILASVFESANKQQDNKQKKLGEIDEWEAEDWEKNTSKIEALQAKFQRHGVGSFITSLIKGNICDNIKLANYTLLCAISYLLGGNKVTQSSIRNELNKDEQNKVFKNIKTLIIKLGGLIRKCIDQDKAHLLQKDDDILEDFYPTLIDNYDYYDIYEKFVTRKSVEEPHYIDQALYYQQCIVTYRRAFKFLQLLCENNNVDNKNFIREQPESSNSIDFIQLATKQLRNIFLAVCADISGIPIFLLDFILQVTQIPVIANQQAFIKSSFIEDLCLLYNTLNKEGQKQNRGFGDDDTAINQLIAKSIQIILSNLEGGRKDNFQLIDEKFEQGFLVKLLKKGLKQINVSNKQEFQKYIQKLTQPKLDQENKKTSQTDFDEPITQVLWLMIIFMKFRDVLGPQCNIVISYQKQKEKQKQLFDALEQCLLKIQIADQYNQIQIVYFPNHPVFKSLSEGLKDHVMLEVDRGTHRQKVVSLLGFVSGIKQKIQESYYFEKCQNLSQKDMISSYNKASHLSLIICLYISIVYQIFIEHGSAEFGTNLYFGFIRFILCLIQFYYSTKYIYIWYKIRIWYKPERVSREKQDPEQVPNEDQAQIQNGKGQNKQEPQKSGISLYIQKIQNFYRSAIEYYKSEEPKFYNSNDFFKIFLFVLVSFVSTFIYPPLIFIHLLDYLLNLSLLGDIVQAIVQVSKPLLWVSFMGVVFTFIFCTLTLSNYAKNVYEDAPEDEMCEGMIGCILDLFVSGVILETMDDFEIVRFTYDTIYSIFFGMLFGNIVSGLLLDTFGQLRQNRDDLDNDKKNKCFICNIQRETLEQHDQNFPDHIHKRHYLWNYIFYIIALEKKSPTDYTGLEYYISQKYNLPDEDMDETWFPDGQGSFDLAKSVDKMIRKVGEGNAEIENHLQDLQRKISEFNQTTVTFKERI